MRLVIKLSGESLRGNPEHYSQTTLAAIVSHIRALQSHGHQIALVVGGGNLFRGAELIRELAIERGTADYVGMLATVQNALILRDYFETQGVVTRVSSAIAMPQICEGYMPKRAIRHMEKGRVVIFASGLGAPYFTTDSTAVQRALEIHADLLVMAKNGVDGVYSADPDKDPNAKLIPHLTASESLEKGLRFADQAAIALAKEHGLSIQVVSLDQVSDAPKKTVGTHISPK
jgi:uridylate kinase